MAQVPVLQPSSILGPPPNIPISQPPAGGMAALAQALPRVGQQLGMFSDEMAQQAEQRRLAEAEHTAQQAAVRDPDGSLVVPPEADWRDASGRRANAIILARVGDEAVVDATNEAVRLRAQVGNDPAQWEARWTGYVRGRIGELPEWVRPALETRLRQIGAQHGQAVALATASEGRQAAAQASEFLRQQDEQDLAGLAYGGQVGTPQYQQGVNRLRARLDEDVRLGRRTREEADARLAATLDNGTQLGVVRHAMDRAADGDAPETILGRLDQEMDRAAVPPAQRERLRNLVESRLNERRALQAGERSEAAGDYEDWNTRITAGVPVPADEGVRLAARLDQLGDHRRAQAVRDTQAVYSDLSAARTLSSPELDRTAAQAQMRALRPDASVRDVVLAEKLERMASQRARSLAADPLAGGAAVHQATVGPLQTLDFSNLEGLPAQLQQRVRQAQQIGALERRSDVLPLTKPEIEGMATLVQNGTTDQQTALIRGLSAGLPPQQLARVLGRLDQREERVRGFTFAAGLSMAGDTRRSNEVLQGLEVLRLLPAPALATDKVAAEVQSRLGPALDLRPDTQAQVIQAVRAIYAQRSRTGAAGDRPTLDGVLDPSKLRAIVDEIMPTGVWGGGLLGGGSRVALPPGMTETQFAERVAALPGGAWDGARASDGRAVTADMVRRGGSLVSTGTGRYRVRYGGFDVLDRGGAPFEIDLNRDYSQQPAGPAGEAAPGAPIPQRTSQLLAPLAQQYGVPLAFAERIAAVESRGTHTDAAGSVRRSSAGAQGLMQLMPDTARGLGVDPTDEAQNARGGVRFLGQMLERYDGNQVLAAAAYNWGPQRVDGWRARGMPADGLPAETQSYLTSVFGRPLSALLPTARLAGRARPAAPGAVAPEDAGWDVAAVDDYQPQPRQAQQAYPEWQRTDDARRGRRTDR
ncbi:lytic transglycosylase domain-containing protein [Roseomonas sp. NAR14]|uniref:Lytic transglycosylase domain-containing protein n=1 Tax=Roseomonas acroporae TaxID=2937791 RepID=A0A9X1YBJ0_9PROT|nr:lytic transglycosylase domain-containing protein [Roseomonas acroporae]MCK8787098.1 lytic transglycosylase domain-containing protein [Roseomonas acroporae]